MMDEMEQIEAIWNKGVKLGERQDEIYKYTLYQIDSFYVEEHWHKEYDVRRALKSFSSTNADLLKPYLEMIDISKITKNNF
jgi:hypothetical protein